jgi:hypothetical protein
MQDIIHILGINWAIYLVKTLKKQFNFTKSTASFKWTFTSK